MARDDDKGRPAGPSSGRHGAAFAPTGRVDRLARKRIGEALRQHYAATLVLPIPDRLRALVDALAEPSDREIPR